MAFFCVLRLVTVMDIELVVVQMVKTQLKRKSKF